MGFQSVKGCVLVLTGLLLQLGGVEKLSQIDSANLVQNQSTLQTVSSFVPEILFGTSLPALWLKSVLHYMFYTLISSPHLFWKMLQSKLSPPSQSSLKPQKLLSIVPLIYHGQVLKVVNPLCPVSLGTSRITFKS